MCCPVGAGHEMSCVLLHGKQESSSRNDLGYHLPYATEIAKQQWTLHSRTHFYTIIHADFEI